MKAKKITNEWLLSIGFNEYDKGMFEMQTEDDEFTIYYWCSVNGSGKGYVVNHNFDSKRLKNKSELPDSFFAETGTKLQFKDHIKYVHQLQNLYFALTNEELQIK